MIHWRGKDSDALQVNRAWKMLSFLLPLLQHPQSLSVNSGHWCRHCYPFIIIVITNTLSGLSQSRAKRTVSVCNTTAIYRAGCLYTELMSEYTQSIHSNRPNGFIQHQLSVGLWHFAKYADRWNDTSRPVSSRAPRRCSLPSKIFTSAFNINIGCCSYDHSYQASRCPNSSS